MKAETILTSSLSYFLLEGLNLLLQLLGWLYILELRM